MTAAKKLIKAHGRLWHDVTLDEQERYHDYTVDLRAEKSALQQQQLEGTIGSLRGLMKLQEQRDEKGSRCLLSSCRFSEVGIADFEGLCKSGIWSKDPVMRLRAAACDEVLQPHDGGGHVGSDAGRQGS